MAGDETREGEDGEENGRGGGDVHFGGNWVVEDNQMQTGEGSKEKMEM